MEEWTCSRCFTSGNTTPYCRQCKGSEDVLGPRLNSIFLSPAGLLSLAMLRGGILMWRHPEPYDGNSIQMAAVLMILGGTGFVAYVSFMRAMWLRGRPCQRAFPRLWACTGCAHEGNTLATCTRCKAMRDPNCRVIGVSVLLVAGFAALFLFYWGLDILSDDFRQTTSHWAGPAMLAAPTILVIGAWYAYNMCRYGQLPIGREWEATTKP